MTIFSLIIGNKRNSDYLISAEVSYDWWTHLTKFEITKCRERRNIITKCIRKYWFFIIIIVNKMNLFLKRFATLWWQISTVATLKSRELCNTVPNVERCTWVRSHAWSINRNVLRTTLQRWSNDLLLQRYGQRCSLHSALNPKRL